MACQEVRVVTLCQLGGELRSSNGSSRKLVMLTPYERADLLGRRATDIAENRGPPIQVEHEGMFRALDIAYKEMKEGKLPGVVTHVHPNGKIDVYRVQDLLDVPA